MPDDNGWNAALHIAIYVHDLRGGGAERVQLDLIREFRAFGHTVTVLLHAREGELLPHLPEDVKVIGFETGRVLSDVRPLARYLRIHRPDVLMSSIDHNNLVALLAKAAAISRIPVIICQHKPLSVETLQMTSLLQEWKYRVVPAFYRLLSPLAGGIVAVSDGVRNDLSNATGISRQRITTIYNPVIGPRFEDQAAEPVSHPWFDSPGPPVYLTAGRLVPIKNHRHLMRAFALHCDGRAKARLMILGNGPLKAELEAFARELGIADQVALPGFVHNPLPYMRRAAAFVLTSDYEGFGNTIVEALGCGTPVVSVDCPFGPTEILEGGRYGRLVPRHDVEALAHALSPDLREYWPPEMLIGRARAFSSSASAAAYLALMRALIPWGRQAGALVAEARVGFLP